MRERVSGRARPWRPGAHLGGLRVPARRGSAAGLPGCPRPAGLRVLRCRPASLSLPHLGATLTGTPTLHPRPGSRAVSPPPTCARATPPGHPTVPPTGSVRIAVQRPLVSLVSTITSQFLRPRVQPFEEARPCPAPVGSSSRDTGQDSGNRHQPGQLLLHRAGLRGATGPAQGRGRRPRGCARGAGCPGLVAAGKGDRAMWRGRRPRAGPEPRKAPQPEARITRGPCGDCVSGASQCNLGGSAASGEVVGPPPSREGRGSRCVRVSGSA